MNYTKKKQQQQYEQHAMLYSVNNATSVGKKWTYNKNNKIKPSTNTIFIK